MKFDFVIGNPPYQQESETSNSKTNGQKPMTNVFHYFQQQADEVANEGSVMIYPGGRWIHQSGKGVKEFGKKQINDPSLSTVEFYPDANEVFGNAASLSDGVTIVTKNKKSTKDGFTYVYNKNGKRITVEAAYPGDKLMPLNPFDLPIMQKVDRVVENKGWKFLHDAILPRSLFSIESDFAEKNPDKVRLFDGKNVDYSKGEIKLFTNDKAGKAGRATWFVSHESVITSNPEYIGQWQVVVSSANAGGQKRDNQLAIIDNHSAFGRARLALRSFETYDEAKNFYSYVDSYLVKYMFLLTDEALSSLGKEVPDIENYKSDNGIIDFTKDVDLQLFQIFGFTSEEIAYVKSVVDGLRKKGDK